MQKFISHQGKRLSYNVDGNGAPLMLLHGFGGDSGLWEKMVQQLAQQFKVITPDMPGTGQSETPDGEPSLENLADGFAAVIKEETNEPCALVGHSMGGYITLALVERHPQLVKAFGLFHSSPFPDDDAKKEKRDKDADFIKRNSSAPFIKVLLPALFAETIKKEHPEIVNGLVERYSSLSPEGLVFALHAMKNRPDRSHIVSSSTRPFLMIAGVEDQVVTMETVARIYKMPQYTFGLFIRQAAHMAMIESPDVCVKHLQSWMKIIADV